MKNSDHDSKKIKKEWKQSSRGLESRIRKGFALAIKYNLNVLVMKNRKGKVPVLNILEDKWENDKVVADKTIWDKLLNGE